MLCVIDCEAGGVANLAAEGLELRALFTMSDLAASMSSDALCPADASFLELVEAVRVLPYGRPSDRGRENVARGARYLLTKHLFLARLLAERFPETEPVIVHHMYMLDRLASAFAPRAAIKD